MPEHCCCRRSSLLWPDGQGVVVAAVLQEAGLREGETHVLTCMKLPGLHRGLLRKRALPNTLRDLLIRIARAGMVQAR